ncbi:MAG: DUF2800 domain-containing protein [Bacillota bacterium]|nr:DUF2800 domain-containing protein [Bacillota bacterium]MDW7678062.1 DUF2800 domain-containing protein [Bacillota bacterium]
MAAHALLSASSAHRWIACTPSARLEEQVQEKDSPYAAEGTLAHVLADLELAYSLGRIRDPYYHTKRADIEMNTFFTPDMHDYVAQYTDFVLERYHSAKARSPDAAIRLEQRVDYSRWVPEGFGTADVTLISEGMIEVIDFKYGQGIAVHAEGNPQMRLYALGALDLYDTLYAIHTVQTIIVQPRKDHVSMEEISTKALLEWADTVVREAAAKAFKGEGEQVAGEHCTFCRVKATCRARAEANLQLAQYEFREPPLLRPDEIAAILSRVDELVNWAGHVKDHALEKALQGERWPGFKLVEGRSVRKYRDDQQVAAALLAAGYDEERIYEKKLKGITALEKAMGRKQLQETLGELIYKPPGKPALVPDTDKRPELSSLEEAISDFEQEE